MKRHDKALITGTCLLLILIPFAAIGSKEAKPLKRPEKITRLGSGMIEMCLSCHFEEPDKAHSRQAAGCWSCHLGNPLAGTPELAHKGMVLNPGEFHVVEKTCGRSSCHAQDAKDIKKTLMATNRGIISTLRYYWGEERENCSRLTVQKLLETGINSPALDYFRKLCGTCHLWLKRRQYPGFLSEKGGGCTACHLDAKRPGGNMSDNKKKAFHPRITKAIGLENCVRCHNRSGRIGLSYQGKYESEGYGTPFEEADFSQQQLPDGRFIWQGLPPDVHFEKGLVCIDCHTQKEVMGDGEEHTHLEEQVEIECSFCHTSQAELERIVAGLKDKKPPFPKITGLKREEKGDIAQVGKISKKKYQLSPPDPKCNAQVHQRLSCQACHSRWVPQCYGCHVQMDGSKQQLDKLSGRETSGFWKEYRSFIRLESPVLGVSEGHDINGKEHAEKIVILVPG